MGVGGAFLMVPAMIYLIGMPIKLVPGTSLFVTIFITGFVVVLHAFTYNTIDLVLVLILISGLHSRCTFWSKNWTKTSGITIKNFACFAYAFSWSFDGIRYLL